MKRLFALILVVSTTFGLFGQVKIPTKEINSIVEEGKLLYRCELASRNGLSLVLRNGIEQNDIRGLFSRVSNDTTIWVCYSKDSSPRVLGTVTFDSTSILQNAVVDISTRPFTKPERELFMMNEQAIGFARGEPKILSFENTVMRSIPIIYKGARKIYLLTQSLVQYEVVFGNDYVITLDKLLNIVSFQGLHSKLIAVNYGKNQENTGQVKESQHVHTEKTGDLITPTDICILLLNAKNTGWKQHKVLTPNFEYVWNFQTGQLSVVTIKH